jgi:hypothetical protein
MCSTAGVSGACGVLFFGMLRNYIRYGYMSRPDEANVQPMRSDDPTKDNSVLRLRLGFASLQPSAERAADAWRGCGESTLHS